MLLIVVDDHPLYLEAISGQLRRAFEGAEVRAFPTLESAKAALSGDIVPDMVLLDFFMPGMGGAEGVKNMVALAGGAPVGVLSGAAEPRHVAVCIAAGARGFFTKTMDNRVLMSAVAVVLYGGTYVPTDYLMSAARGIPGGEAAAGPSDDTYSDRDTLLLQRVSEGASNKDIARELGLQENTVKFYLGRLFRRLGVKNRAQAAVEAIRLGLAKSPDPAN